MKKLLSIILVLAMIASLFANVGVVFASGYVAKVGDVYFTNLNDAFMYAMSINGEVEMLNDTDVNENQTAPSITSDGTEESPYLISTLEDLKWFRDDVNAGNSYAGKYIKLTADIDLATEEDWTPIGDSTNKFSGYFDGDNHTISNLKIIDDGTDEAMVGLFGYAVGKNMINTVVPTIQNLKLTNVNVTSTNTKSRVGGLAGTPYTAYIKNVHVTGTVSGGKWTGGISGNCYALFEDCSFEGTVTGAQAGGISGAGDARVYNSKVIANITANTWAGGIVGNGQEGASAVGCYVKGTIVANNNWYRGVGGIAGVAGHGYAGSIFENNYFDGEVYLAGEKINAVVMGIVNVDDNADLKTTVEGNSWNTEYYPADTVVAVVGAGVTKNATEEEWYGVAASTDERNNNLVMNESDLAYVDATDMDDVTIMSFSTVTEEQVENVVADNNLVAEVNGIKYATLAEAINNANGDTVVLLRDVVLENSLTIAKDTTVTIDLAGYEISGVDTTEKNFGLINNNGTLTVNDTKGTGKITLSATINSEWNRYSAVISNNPGGTLTVNGGALEHLGGTDMAYGIDSLTNGGIGDVKVTINGGSVTSTYRAIRQFLNSDSKQNELVINGGTITGAKQAIFFQDPSAKANNGKLTITENAAINGGVYLFVTEGSTEWPVEVSIAAAAIKTGEVTSKNVPEGYEVKNENGVYGVGEVTCVATIDGVEYTDLQAAINAANGKKVVLVDDITTNGTITIPADVVVTLDMNGKTITANDEKASGNYELFYNYGSLTVIGNGTISLTATTDRSWNASSSIFHNRGGVLVIENGTFTHNGGTSMAYVVDNSGNSYGDATTTVKDGTLKSTYIAIRNRMDTYSANGGGNGVATVNVEGGNLSGKYAIWGQVSSNGVKGAINITGGTFTAAEGKAAVLVDKDTTGDINTAISGGTFSSDVSDYCVDGFTCEQNADGTYGVVEVEYNTWDTKGGFIKGLPDEENSITMLLVVGIQGRNYAEAGFEVTVGDTVVDVPTNFVYTKINIKYANGESIGDPLVGATFGENNDYILCAKVLLPTDFDGKNISFRAYLVDYEGNKMYAKNTNGRLDYVGTIGREIDK